MPRRFVDLSIYLENEVLSDPPILAPKIEYKNHKETLGEFMHLLPGTKEADYPDGEAAGKSPASGLFAAALFTAGASTAEGARPAAVLLWPVFSSLATTLLFRSGSPMLSALSDLIC